MKAEASQHMAERNVNAMSALKLAQLSEPLRRMPFQLKTLLYDALARGLKRFVGPKKNSRGEELGENSTV